jgi:hypothetical protein
MNFNRKSIIPVTALVTFGVMVLADQGETQGKGTRKKSIGHLPTTKEWLGFIVVFTMLSAGADLGLDFAGGFAVLVMITMMLVRGPEALEFLTGKFQGKKLTKGKAKPGEPPPHRTAGVAFAPEQESEVI